MMPIHQIIFNKRTPRISPKVEADLLRVGNWFGEELFTYIRVFGSLANPHVPMYVPEKLLAREIAYQTVGNGISKIMKESNKKFWPTFPFRCGMFTLDNFKHAAIEVKFILELRFPTIPNREYGPQGNC